MDFLIPKGKEQTENTAKLIVKAYGIPAVDTFIYKSGIDRLKKEPFTNPETGSLSFFGKPVFSNLVIKARDYLDIEGNKVTTFKNDIILDTVLFDVGQQKNIITTPIQGLNGTIKEYISDGDYSINIKGMLVGKQNGQFPLDLAKDLQQGLKAPISLDVHSWFLSDIMGVSNMVVTYFQYTQEMGRQQSLSFEIQAISDAPVEIRLKKIK